MLLFMSYIIKSQVASICGRGMGQTVLVAAYWREAVGALCL